MRKNLIQKLRDNKPIFPGIVGYEETVIPQVENAILSGQDIVFLGERGQAKTRMARSLVSLIDERSEEHTSELQSCQYLVCRIVREKKKTIQTHSLQLRLTKTIEC